MAPHVTRSPSALLSLLLALAVGPASRAQAPSDTPAQAPPVDAPAPVPPAGEPTAPPSAAPDAAPGATPDASDDAPLPTDPDATPPDEGPVEADQDTIDAAAEDAEFDESLLDAVLEEEERSGGPQRLRLGPVTVSVRRVDVFREGGSVATIEEEELRQLRTDDPTAVLQRVPGVYVRTEDGYGLRPNVGLRGTNPDRSSRMTLMEDSVLFGPAPYSAPAAYYFPLMLRMTGVEVFKGPAAILYGPATVAGAINLRTREVPDGSDGAIDLGYGTYRNRRMHLWYGASNRWGGFVVEGADLATTGFKEIDFADDADTGFHRGEYTLRGHLQTDEDAERFHRVELRLGTSFEDSHETYVGLSDADFREDPYRRYVATANDRMRWRRYSVALRHRYALGRELEIETALYRNDLHRVWDRIDGFANGPALFDVLNAPESPAMQPFYRVLTGQEASSYDPTMRTDDTLMQARNDRTYVSQGAQTRVVFDRRGERANHRLEVGVRLHYDSIARDHTLHGLRVDRPLTATDPDAVQLVRDGFAPEQETLNRARSLAFAAHASYAFERANLRVLPGLRTEVIRGELEDELADTRASNLQTVVLPGLGLQYTIRPWLAAFAGVHRGFAPVAPGQSGDVRPESTVSYELGGRVQDDARELYVELSGFFNDYRNLLLACGGSSGCAAASLDSQFNAGSANVGGVELLYSQRIGLPHGWKLPVRVAYTYTLGRFRDVADPGSIGAPGYQDARDGDELPYVPRHQAQAQLGLEGHGAEVTLRFAYVGTMRENATADDDDALLTDDAFLLDAGASYEVTRRIRLYVRGENLLNQQVVASRRPFGARPVRPLTAMAGVQIALGALSEPTTSAGTTDAGSTPEAESTSDARPTSGTESTSDDERSQEAEAPAPDSTPANGQR